MPDLVTSLRDVLGDRYQLEAELGRGGMGTVYRAVDRKHGRPVAIKVLPPELALVVGSERFQREIAIAAGLQHPNIVPLYDSGGDGEVLYYIMPLVAGETLRERLERETQLPVADALEIAREVADALGYAHSRGIVHRDIKPENILLSAGRALVADFGIARAIGEAGGPRLTERGLAIGTPAYMSPEQAGGEPVDGRADLYALGCVLYEMLAGEPPFTGRTAQAVLARQLADRPPSLQVVRPTVSLAMQRVIETALAKVPADRFATATRFVAALEAAESGRAARRRRLAGLAIGAALTVVAVVVVKLGAGFLPSGATDAGAADTSRYAILPFERDRSVNAAVSEDQLLHDALTRWSGIAVVDPFQVRDAMARRGRGPLDSREARRVAAELGAGRYVRGEVSALGDSLRVHAGLYDAVAGGNLLAEATIRLPLDLRGADALFAALADRLLFRGAGPGARAEARVGTRSAPARQAYARGHGAIERWDLEAADSAFAAAAGYDQEYAQAFLWLAQVRSWNGAPAARWQSAAERAAAGRSRLSSRDQVLSDALVALGRGEAERACGMWRGLSRRDQHDFASWFGLANCLSRDDAVLADGGSPSRWRFRSSYHEATGAYERAFRLLPSIHRALRGSSFEGVRRLLFTSSIAVRRGQALPPDTTTFAAHPSWERDTLTFVPYPRQEILARPWALSEATNLAVRRQRERFHDIATSWVTAYPRSADAVQALAISLDLLGDRSALDTLRRARELAATAEERLRAAGAEVWMRVKAAIPADPMALQGARELADSLLRSFRPTSAPELLMLASLAALTGQAQRAADISRHPSVAAEWAVPASLAASAPPLLVFSALGGPADSLRVLEWLVDSVIGSAIPAPSRRFQRLRWLARSATLAMPHYRFRSLPGLVGSGDYLVDAQAAFARNDTATVRSVFADLARARRLLPPAELTLDAVYPEAWLLAALGEDSAAVAWLEPTLAALPAAPPQMFVDPVRAGCLVRAMALRAELAQRHGDRAAAARWARLVALLWSDADPFLQPIVRRMERLAV